MAETQLFLIDAHAICYRSFYAIKGLSNSKGQQTNAVYGFANTLRKLLREYQPRYCAVCFDSPARTHRQQKFADYKIQRPAMPDELIPQIGMIKDLVGAYRLPVIEVPGYEADDILATVARRYASPEIEVIIVSDDKDLYQLVNDRVAVLSPRKERILRRPDVKEALGVFPEQVVDFIGLSGDKIDNIPGVRGIGAVSARRLLEQFGTLEQIFDKIDQVPSPAMRDRLREQADEARLSQDLAGLAADVPVDFDLEDMRVTAPDQKHLLTLFSELEFNRFAAEAAESLGDHQQLEIVEVGSGPAARALAERIRASGRFAFWIDRREEESLALASEVLWVAVDQQRVSRVVVDCLPELADLWEDAGVVKITHGLKDQLARLDQRGVAQVSPAFDVELAAYLLAPSRGGFDIKGLAWQYLKITLPEHDPVPHGVQAVWQLYAPLRQELEAHDLWSLLTEIEIPLATVLMAMEREGVSLDCGLLRGLSAECDAKIHALHKTIYAQAGEEFNLNSPKQLSRVLFEKLQLPVIKRTKTGFSTNEEVLSQLSDRHPIPALILEYRQLAKLKSTYIDALPKLINPATGRVHASFHQTGTETGRLSSSNPNLQNIPIRTELGRQIRRAFVPSSADRLIVAADYSQIELRILAHLSGDETLIQAFQSGEDIHAYTAALIYEIPEAEVTAEMRHAAKRVNFGIIYGMSAFGLAKDLNISQREAADFIDRYFLRYPRVKVFMDEQIRLCEAQGYVTTILHRRRYLPEITSDNQAVRQFAQRQAINTPVQGSAADLMKLAMIRLHQDLQTQGLASRLIINVHDELVFDAPAREQERLVTLIRDRMENAAVLVVPLTVSIHAGRNWAEAK